jgi:hypothetical protein
MKYLGNFKEAIPDGLIEDLINFKYHDSVLEPLANDNRIKLPEQFGKNLLTWYSKFEPGQGISLHSDDNTEYLDLPTDKIARYVLFLQDWIPGHIFLYQDKNVLTDYKAGDLYLYSDPNVVHAACNLSNSVRVTYQILAKLNEETI